MVPPRTEFWGEEMVHEGLGLILFHLINLQGREARLPNEESGDVLLCTAPGNLFHCIPEDNIKGTLNNFCKLIISREVGDRFQHLLPKMALSVPIILCFNKVATVYCKIFQPKLRG